MTPVSSAGKDSRSTANGQKDLKNVLHSHDGEACEIRDEHQKDSESGRLPVASAWSLRGRRASDEDSDPAGREQTEHEVPEKREIHMPGCARKGREQERP